MSHEVETLFYAGAVPWHGLGVGVAETQSSAEAMALAGLDWEVKVGPLYGPKHEGTYRRVERFSSVYRSTDKKVLGISTGGRYTPLQNAEAFDFLDSLLQDGILRYETAGSLFGGRQVFLLARLEEGMRVGDDQYFNYMLLTNRHDLLGKVRILPTTVRVVCNNTLQMALGGGTNREVSIVHSGLMQSRLKQAKEALRITTESSRRMAEWLSRLQDLRVTPHDIQAVTTAIFGAGSLDAAPSPQRRRAIETFQAIYAAEVSLAGAETAYALANAVTGDIDHTRRYTGTSDKRVESRFTSLTAGVGASTKESTLRLIGDLVGEPLPGIAVN